MNEQIKELDGTVCLQIEQRWENGEKVSETFHAMTPADCIIGKSAISLEDALHKVVEARKAKATEPKVVHVNQFDAQDLALMDELISYATLLEMIEDDVNADEEWLKPRLPGILSATSKKLCEIHEKFYEKM